ncbi:MAG: hypothetical protein FJ086_04080 [Deltaproteobacteria bacterium]|nr:hypothetical protein [Deltaproteobacteria bacterium]
MDAFVATITTFPVLPLTVLLGISVGYWAFTLLTGADADVGGDAVGGGLKAAGESVAGALKSTAHQVADAGELLSVLGIGRVPVTMTFSAAALGAWTSCTLLSLWISPEALLLKLALLTGSSVAGLLGAAALLRPLGRALARNEPARQRDALGRTCVVTSGKVDAEFGTALVEDGGAGLNVHVTCSKPNGLKKGDRALLLEFDPKKDSYEVEPVEWLLPEEVASLDDPERVSQVLSRVRQK